MIVRRFLTPPLVIGVLLVAAVAVAGGFITSPLPIDTTVWNDFIASRTPAMNTFMTGASWLFDPKRAVIVAVAVAAFVWWLVKKVMHALYILGSVAFSGINGYIIKHIDSRPRPEEAYRLITEDGYSFPSGHATAVTALIVSLVLVLTMTRLGRHRFVDGVGIVRGLRERHEAGQGRGHGLDRGGRVRVERARADGLTFNVGGLAGGDVTESLGGDPARGEEGVDTLGEGLVDGRAARGRRKERACSASSSSPPEAFHDRIAARSACWARVRAPVPSVEVSPVAGLTFTRA